MTSMPFTDSITPPETSRPGGTPGRENLPKEPLLAFLRAVALGQLLLLRVLLRGGADHRLDDRLVGFVDLLLQVPLLAVPDVQRGAAPARMVDAGGADRIHEP